MSGRGMRLLPYARQGGRYTLGQSLVSTSTGAPAVTFHLLTESQDFLVTVDNDFIDVIH